MSTVNLPSKFIQDENGNKFAPITTPEAVRWPDGSDLTSKFSGLDGKEDEVTIESISGTTLTAEVGKYYTATNIGTLTITLPTIAAGTTTVKTITFFISVGTAPDVHFVSTHPVYYSDGYTIASNKAYEVFAAYNGIAWIVTSVKIIIPST